MSANQTTENTNAGGVGSTDGLGNCSIPHLVMLLRDESAFRRNDATNDLGRLLETAANTLEGMLLLQSGREQNQRELNACVGALDHAIGDSLTLNLHASPWPNRWLCEHGQFSSAHLGRAVALILQGGP